MIHTQWRTWLSRYGLLAWWLIFAVLTLRAGRYPGLVRDPATAPYPWRGVMITLVLLAVETGILYGILRPRTFNKAWGRFAIAATYLFALVALGFATTFTDMPGYYYMPAIFAIGTFIGLIVVGLVIVIADGARRSDVDPPAP